MYQRHTAGYTIFLKQIQVITKVLKHVLMTWRCPCKTKHKKNTRAKKRTTLFRFLYIVTMRLNVLIKI